jgi:hypothetical protein
LACLWSLLLNRSSERWAPLSTMLLLHARLARVPVVVWSTIVAALLLLLAGWWLRCRNVSLVFRADWCSGRFWDFKWVCWDGVL